MSTPFLGSYYYVWLRLFCGFYGFLWFFADFTVFIALFRIYMIS